MKRFLFLITICTCLLFMGCSQKEELCMKVNYIYYRSWGSYYLSRIIYDRDDNYNYYYEIHSQYPDISILNCNYCIKSDYLCDSVSVEENGLVFKFKENWADTVRLDCEDYGDYKVCISDTIFGKKYGEYTSAVSYSFIVCKIGQNREYIKYFFDDRLRILLKWELYNNNEVYKYRAVTNIDYIQKSLLDSLDCR